MKWLERFSDFDLAPDDQRALIYVREVGAINNAAYRSFSDVDRLTASAHLRSLRDKDLLVQRGKGTGTYYVAGPLFNDRPRARPAADRDQSRPPEVLPHVHRTREEIFGKLPPETHERLSALGRYAKGDILRAAVIEILSYEPMTVSEIAITLGRSTQLIYKILPSLIAAGYVRRASDNRSRYERAEE